MMQNHVRQEELTALAQDDSEVSQSESPAGFRSYRVFTMTAVIFGVAASVTASMVFLPLGRDADSGVSPRMLIESPEVADIMTDNVMTLEHLAPGERDEVRRQAGDAATEVVAGLHERLGASRLTAEKKLSALRMARSMGDRRTESLHKDFVAAIKETLSKSEGSVELKQRIAEKFNPRMAELRGLRDDYFPEHVNGPADGGRPLVASHLDGMRLAKAFDRLRARLDAESSASATEALGKRRLTASTTSSMYARAKDMFEQFKESVYSMFGLNDETTAAVDQNDEGTFQCIKRAATTDSKLYDCFTEFVDSVKSSLGLGKY